MASQAQFRLGKDGYQLLLIEIILKITHVLGCACVCYNRTVLKRTYFWQCVLLETILGMGMVCVKEARRCSYSHADLVTRKQSKAFR